MRTFFPYQPYLSSSTLIHHLGSYRSFYGRLGGLILVSHPGVKPKTQIEKNLENLQKIRTESAIELLGLYKKANAGHIASSLSCLEILIYLSCHKMKESDYLILSKGHAACGLYVALAQAGRLSKDLLSTYYANGTMLAAHPSCSGKIPSIPFGTGSLGHGLSLATGLVLSQQFTKKNFKVFAVLSDGDCNEGSTWEAALFAGHHQLQNLHVIIDYNKLQGIGSTESILDMQPMNRKWEEFGFETFVAEDGNDFDGLNLAFKSLEELDSKKPKCIVANTTKGHGVSFMQNRVEWHYLPMSETEFKKAIEETDA